MKFRFRWAIRHRPTATISTKFVGALPEAKAQIRSYGFGSVPDEWEPVRTLVLK